MAIYYSHPSIQLGWILDAEAHGKTWTNRNGDDRLGASHQVRHAWENMLRDSGLQYNFISYADVIQHGMPSRIQGADPARRACACRMPRRGGSRRSAEAGGTVIADYLPGLWDQHGKGRSGGGALDDMFGVQHDPAMKRGRSVRRASSGARWTRTPTFSWKTYEEFLTNENTVHPGRERLQQGRARRCPSDHVNQLRQGDGGADEPVAAVVQRLPRRREPKRPKRSAPRSSIRSRRRACKRWVELERRGRS